MSNGSVVKPELDSVEITEDMRKDSRRKYERDYYARKKKDVTTGKSGIGECSNDYSIGMSHRTVFGKIDMNVAESNSIASPGRNFEGTTACQPSTDEDNRIHTRTAHKRRFANNERTEVVDPVKDSRRKRDRANYYQKKENAMRGKSSIGQRSITSSTCDSQRSVLGTIDVNVAQRNSIVENGLGSQGSHEFESTSQDGNIEREPMSSESSYLMDFDDFESDDGIQGHDTQGPVTHVVPNPSLNDDVYAFVYNGVPATHRVLTAQPPCRHCHAKRFQYEFRTFCCMDGKIRLAHTAVPDELYNLFSEQSELGRIFRSNVRAYNTNYAFTSMGVELDTRVSDMRSGVYTFRAHGAIYHRIDQLIPRDGRPRYLQLYFLDSESETANRLQWPNLDRRIVDILTRVLTSNPYVQTFRSLAQLGPLDNYRVSLNASVDLDQRVYNRPSTSEVAGIWIEGNENITTFKRSIVLYGRHDHIQYIQSYFGCYDPLSYPLFFPGGESGWHNGILIDNVNGASTSAGRGSSSDSRKTVSMREYYCYKFQIRPHPDRSLLLLGGRLLQQFIVDMYIKIETARLSFISYNQSRIRADLYQGIVDCINTGEVHPDRVGQRVVLPASFIGGPRDMRCRYLDAMCLVQCYGKPDIFLTMTCNPKWEEITKELKDGQNAQDRPELVSRVFRSKLEDLKDQLFKRDVLGVVAAHVYVVEFQKRGLPHAHFLLIMAPGHKILTPDDYDSLVCAEIPNPSTYPELHNKVVKHMLHGPCGNLRPSSPCMQGDPSRCRFRFPKRFNAATIQGDDAYPVYRRRDNGINVRVRGQILDNRWVVPYNPMLLMMYNCHINVEACSSIVSVKYIFKYIYKGHDRQVVHVGADGDPAGINEIKRFQDARYVSPPEAIWRIFSFNLSNIQPCVMALQIHLPNNQYVRFRDDDELTDIVNRERNKRSMLTAFFERNRMDVNARQYLYKDFPTYFTWDYSKRIWNPRKQKLMKGRLVTANPAEGERYYLRILLLHVSGPKSFEDLYKVNNDRKQTFRQAALERGLIDDDGCLSKCLEEASLFEFPYALRRLFATILVYCEPGDVRKLWDAHYAALSEDFRRHDTVHIRVQNLVLKDIADLLNPLGKRLSDFDLPQISEDVCVDSYSEIHDERSIPIPEAHMRAYDSLNSEQKAAFDEIITHVNEDRPGVFFIDGPGGTGKTFLYKALLAEVRSRGLIALATASSGAAANNMPGGRTAHSRFKIPLILENNSMCSIKQQSGVARLLRLAKLIIWDEASMSKRQAIEAVDRTMQEIVAVRLPFGGKVVVLGGDFRQVLPVVRGGTRAQVVDASIRMSPLWPSINKIRLTINMRALTDQWFSSFLLRIGNGEEDTVDGNFVRIPNNMTIPYVATGESVDRLIDFIFPNIESNGQSSDYIISRAILSTKNTYVDELNNKLIDRFCGAERTYYSFDEVEDDTHNLYQLEFLNSINVSGLPPHKLRLKIGCPIMLLRNIDQSNGLCNGTRLICRGFQPNVIDAEIVFGEHAGKRVFLPRIPLSPSADDIFPFKLKRKQFPVRLSFSMTINKAQGQTIPTVGVYLPESVFSHGQLYVALSRGVSSTNTKVLVHPEKRSNRVGVYTSNVVYREVLCVD